MMMITATVNVYWEYLLYVRYHSEPFTQINCFICTTNPMTYCYHFLNFINEETQEKKG